MTTLYVTLSCTLIIKGHMFSKYSLIEINARSYNQAKSKITNIFGPNVYVTQSNTLSINATKLPDNLQ